MAAIIMRAGFLAPLLQTQERVFGVRNARTGEWVVTRLESAFDSTARRRGLLGRTGLAPGAGLVIAPTNAVHTFWMQFDIDIVFVRRDGRVIRVSRDVRPRWVALRRVCANAAHRVIGIHSQSGYAIRGRPATKKARGSGPFCLLRQAPDQSGLMFVAWSPFGPVVMSKETFWFSFRLLKPEPWIAEKCANTSLPPPSGVMKPKPFASLNHLTVPVAMSDRLSNIN